MLRTVTRIHPRDTVAVALRAISKGEQVSVSGISVTVLDNIPAGHKIALGDIAPGQVVVKYGFPIGRATTEITAGSHIHVHNLVPTAGNGVEYHYDPHDVHIETTMGQKPVKIKAYRRPDGQIGVRNEIWVVPTVGCVNELSQRLAHWACAEFAGKGVDGVYALTHPYGCSQLGEDEQATWRILADLALHPNAGAVLVVGLGCENNTMAGFQRLLADLQRGRPHTAERTGFMIAQQCDDEFAEGKKQLTKLFEYASSFTRTATDASHLILGMKCGASDGFSGITANPLAGYVSDTIAALGGAAILTEVTEMFGAEQALYSRCATAEMAARAAALLDDFKAYFVRNGEAVYDCPSPGNKDGGLTTLEDKSLGCVQKGGSAPIKAVLRYGERLVSAVPNACTKGVGGLALLGGPGNDFVSATALTAAGAHMLLFTTGRGTPFGAPVPTIKISSNSAIAKKKRGWVDFDAGRVLSEKPAKVKADMLRLVWEVASGKRTRNEINGNRQIGIFKRGVIV
jgi:altronate hydrolase